MLFAHCPDGRQLTTEPPLTFLCRIFCLGLGLTGLSCLAQPSQLALALTCSQQGLFEAPPSALSVADSGQLTLIPSAGAPMLISSPFDRAPSLVDLSLRIGERRTVLASDERYFLTVGLAGDARTIYEIRELPSGKVLRTLDIPELVTAAAFHSTKGLFIATEKDLRWYAEGSWALVASLRFPRANDWHRFRVDSVAWNQQGTRVVLTWIFPNDGSDDPCKSERDAHSGVEVIEVESLSRQWSQYRVSEVASKVIFAADGKSLLYASDHGLELIPTSSDRRSEAFVRNQHTWDISPTLDRRAIASLSGEHLFIFESLTGVIIAKIGLSDLVPSGASRVALSPDGGRVALASRTGQVCVAETKSLVAASQSPIADDKESLWQHLGKKSQTGFETQKGLQSHPDWVTDFSKRLEEEQNLVRAVVEPWLQKLDHESYHVRSEASERFISALRAPDPNFAANVAAIIEQEAKQARHSLETRVKLVYLGSSNESANYRRAFPHSESQVRRARLKPLPHAASQLLP